MKVGSGWSKETENGRKYISTSIAKEVQVLYPQLKDVSITLWYVPKEERKKEESPAWEISLTAKSDQKKKAEAEAEQTKAEATTEDEDEIPF
jgi:uncharacterized protein (DUF736 family)